MKQGPRTKEDEQVRKNNWKHREKNEEHRGDRRRRDEKSPESKGKLKQRRGSNVGGTTLPHHHLRLQAADSRNKQGRLD